MTIEHMDNFSMYGGTPALMLNGVYAANAQVQLVADPDGISTGKVMKISSGNAGGVRYVLPAAQAIVGIHARIWAPDLNFNAPVWPSFVWYDVSGLVHVILDFDTTGRARLRKYDGSAAGVVVATSTNPVITANGWWDIEAKLTTGAGATDAFELRVEGITIASMTQAAIDLNIESIYQAGIGTLNFSGNSGTATTVYWKDIVIWNGAGAQNNNFLGAVIVYDLPPTADVALNWTPTPAGNGYSILATAPPNDTHFITAPNPPPAAYKGSHGNLPPDVTSVKAIMTMVRAAKTDGGDASLQIGVISDPAGAPATVLGANRPITVAQTYWRDVFELDPKTAAAWLPAAVNLSQIQINRTV